MSPRRAMGRGPGAASLLAFGLLACGGGPARVGSQASAPAAGAAMDDRSRCDFHGRTDREVSESRGPGATFPNVRRVYQLIGTGPERQKVLICREVDTNLDGIKDVVRFYNEKGESLFEEADSDYDGVIDTWLTFAGGRVVKEARATAGQGKPNVWKYYADGRVSRIERDTNGDGKPDRWELYADGKLERIGVDLDHDGQVDRWDRDEIKKLADEAAARKSEDAASEASAEGKEP